MTAAAADAAAWADVWTDVATLTRPVALPLPCPAARCREGVPPGALTCAGHWRQVPRAIRRATRAAWRAHPEDRNRAHRAAIGRALAPMLRAL